MMRRVVLVMLIVTVAAALSGCVVRRAEDTETRSETRTVSGFDEVEFSGYGSLDIVQGDRFELELTGPADLVERTETEVKGDTLFIGQKASWTFWLFNVGSRKIDVRLVVPELSAVEVSGAGDVTIDGLEGDSFEFRLSGAGELSGSDLDLDELTVDMSGAGKTELDGTADNQDITVSGAGEFDGRDLKGRDVRIEMSGAGKATVWAEDDLEIQASGAGSVEYYGNPNVTSDLSGVGSVEDRGER